MFSEWKYLINEVLSACLMKRRNNSLLTAFAFPETSSKPKEVKSSILLAYNFVLYFLSTHIILLQVRLKNKEVCECNDLI